jgi:16S rRNA (cytosine967-C5)-methyltransferase
VTSNPPTPRPSNQPPRRPNRPNAGPASPRPARASERPGPQSRPGPKRVEKQGDRYAPAATPLPIPLGDVARDLVYRKLARQAQHYPVLLIDELSDDAPGTRGMNPRDLAFAHAVYDAVIARWITLGHLLQPCVNQPVHELEARMRAVLLAAAAQLLLLDKVPAYAAINNAVEWAKERIRPGAGAMVNAVLRKLARLRPPSFDPEAARPRYSGARNELPLSDGTAILLSEDAFPEEEHPRLAAAVGLPLELVYAWTHHQPASEVRRLALHSLAAPPTILHTAHAVAPLSSEQSAILAAHAVPGHHVFAGSRAELVALLAARTDLWVQDPASSASLASISDLPLDGAVIIDACAGQGTKTRQLAALFPTATIIASDVDRRRFEALGRTFESHPRVRVVPYVQLKTEFLHAAHLVVLDVPCSNTGVLARRPEARHRFSKDSLASVVNLQRQIIADAIPLLLDGQDARGRGMILYATCSLEPAENEEQAEWACKWHRFKTERQNRTRPSGGPGDAPTAWTDGSYAALLS